MITDFRALSLCLTPMTHMRGVEGNEALIAREPVMTPDGRRHLPCLSGNAIRHRMIRAPGARLIVERWGLAGRLTMRHLNFLFHGGSLAESTSRLDPRTIAEFHRVFPLYRLIGCSLPNSILPGSLIADRGVLVCRENAARVRAVAPRGDGFDVPDNLRPAESFVDGWQYTRGEATKHAPLADPSDGDAGGETRMIYGGECVLAGAAFAHGFICQHVSDLEVGALLASLSLWADAGATIGGMSARGHGRLLTAIRPSRALDAPGLIAAYLAHLDAMREDGSALLSRLLAPEPEKPAGKGRKPKAGAA